MTCCDRHVVTQFLMTDYCKEAAYGYEIKVGNVKKNIPNLGNKTNSIVPYKNLQLCLSLGM